MWLSFANLSLALYMLFCDFWGFADFLDLQSREAFRASGGPKLVVGVITDGFENIEVLRSGFSVIAAAATGNEVIKESFMELKTDELILRALSAKSDGSVDSLYDAIRILLTPDDTRVLASQVSQGFLQYATSSCLK